MKKLVLKIIYLVAVAAFLLIVLEFAARALGAGNPILYYNAAEGGMRPLPDQQITRGQDKFVTIDSNGFRSASTDLDALKILYLGDSVTWGGTHIDDSDTFAELASSQIAKKLSRPVYSMNAAVNGHSLMNQADIYFANDIVPDLLVWLFPAGDLERSYATAGHLSPARFKPKFALVEIGDALLTRFWSNSLRERSETKEKYVHPDTPTGKEEFFKSVMEDRFDSNKNALSRVIADASAKGIPMVLGITPTKKENTWTSDLRVLDKLESTDGNVARLDVLEELRAQDVDLQSLFVDNVHFSEEGHLVVSKIVAEKLDEQLNRSSLVTESPPGQRNP